MANHISRRRFVTLTFGSIIGFGLTACGGGGASGPTGSSAPAAGSGPAITLAIGSAGDDSRFDKETLVAPAGSKITLTFSNKAKPETNRQFNWVLVKPGTQLKVVNDGLTEGEANGFVKPNDPNVIVATKLLKAGESDSVTFDAPAPGDYPYVCTYPGFYTRMRGVLTIK